MSEILKYDKSFEPRLLGLLKQEPDWESFTNATAIDKFKDALLNSETFVCESGTEICGYIRAINDGFGIYISELYVAPGHRKKGYGRALLHKIKDEHPDQDVYVLSDEDLYYEKLGYKRIGSIFQL